MKTSWTQGILPFLAVVGFSAGILVATWKQADTLAGWAQEPGVVWNLISLCCFGVVAILVARTYAQLRNPRLYVLMFLLLPMGVVSFFHYSNPPLPEEKAQVRKKKKAASISVTVGDPQAQKSQGNAKTKKKKRPPPKKKKKKLHPGGSPSGPSTAKTPEQKTADPPTEQRSMGFVGLPDTTAKENPELVRRLRRLFRALHGFGFLLFPLALLATTPLGALSTRRRRKIRVLTLIMLAGEIALAAWLVHRWPEGPIEVSPALLYLVMTAAVLVALALWQSPGGLGGGLAGLILYLLPASLASAGISFTDLGLPLKPLPPASERILVLCFPLALLMVIGREWIVGMSHTTQFDALTQIFNKAYADSIVKGTGGNELGHSYCIAILDIDHFKKVNDTYGHGAGDDVLHAVAQAISNTVHNRGLVCRTGGEEMTVFFPGVDLSGAQEVLEEVRMSVEELKVKTTDMHGRAMKLSVTLSAGLASNQNSTGEMAHNRVQDVVAAADRAVYTAKESGRNRVEVDHTGTVEA